MMSYVKENKSFYEMVAGSAFIHGCEEHHDQIEVLYSDLAIKVLTGGIRVTIVKDNMSFYREYYFEENSIHNMQHVIKETAELLLKDMVKRFSVTEKLDALGL